MPRKKISPLPVAEAMKDSISSITASGYKSIYDEQTIELRPLTILAGANSSGKSSMMQPLLLLKQTLEAPYNPGSLLLNGPNVNFTSVEQLLSKRDGESARVFKVGLGLGENNKIDFNFQKKSRTKKVSELVLVGMSLIAGNQVTNFTPKLDDPQLRTVIEALREGQAPEVDFKLARSRGFFVITPVPKKKALGGGEAVWQPLVFMILEKRILDIIHLPAYHGNPHRAYPTATAQHRYSGIFNPYLGTTLWAWQEDDREKSISLNRTLKDLGLTSRVVARYVDDANIEILVGRTSRVTKPLKNDLVNIADVGFGVSNILPVVAALLAAEPGQIVYLEEPEIHLHPNAQHQLAGVLADAARRGVIVVAETHSTFLLRGIQTLVVKGDLPADYVKLHWFTRNPKDGATTVASAGLNAKGAYGAWPQDFDDVSLQVEKDYLDARTWRSSSR